MGRENLKAELDRLFPEDIKSCGGPPGEQTIVVRREVLRPVMECLKSPAFDFCLLLDLTCVDYAAVEGTFEMVYHLYSLARNDRLRIKTRLPAGDLSIGTLTGLWKNAGWLEREVFDMFGVEFRGHPDLRRILLYDGFEGHPLRKDYPLRKRQPLIPGRGD